MAKDPELFCPSRTVAAHHSERRDPKQFLLGKSTIKLGGNWKLKGSGYFWLFASILSSQNMPK
jgi:hypothetical protein